MTLPNMTNVLVIDSKGRSLLVHNCKNKSDRWEFPGGKLKNGESLDDCGRREPLEELGMRVELESILGDYETSSPEGKFLCRTYLASSADEPRLLEPEKINAFAWLHYSDLESLRDAGTLVPNLVSMLPELKSRMN